ncbi:hypothetical protein HMPREF2851_06235 [Actinomyces sp. HMSC064C12]|nr:hypothetical protein HMPREF2851_06235 [Actinomyces sp. HMSC064C12]
MKRTGEVPEEVRRLLLDAGALDAEIASLSKHLDQNQKLRPLPLEQHPCRVSVIVPAYNAAATLGRTLTSLGSQSLPATDYEVLVILNGPEDGSSKLLEEFGQQNQYSNLRWVRADRKGAGRARNIGLSMARGAYVTFVDADDAVEPHFLEQLLAHAGKDVISVAPIVNYVGSAPQAQNSLADRINNNAGKEVAVDSVPWMLGFNACKLLPAKIAAALSYREDLESGEDVVYFASALAGKGLHFHFPDQEGGAYLRFLTPDSVSRQEVSYAFNVRARLDCVWALEQARKAENSAVITSLISAQYGFAVRYLQAYPEKADLVEADLAERSLLAFPWQKVNEGKATNLVFAYCFSPFSDTSATVAAKVVADLGAISDVISNDMSKLRRKDQSLSVIADRWIEHKSVVNAPVSFSGWEPTVSFAHQAVAVAERQAAAGSGYRTMYSRALWAASHVAAFLFKRRHPQVRWTAEFSDPLRRDVTGNLRSGTFSEGDMSKMMLRYLSQQGYQLLEQNSYFELIEICTFLAADELIFTNDNQLDYMVADYPDDIRRLVKAKATVRHHPTPPAASYEVVESDYKMPSGVVNIAYFGAFYKNRGLDDVFVALRNLSQAEQRKVRFHVFCNKPKEVKERVTSYGIDLLTYVNGYLPYLEFLNVCKQCQVLLLNDAICLDTMPINPFLPSKYADYLGAGRDIWALVEPGSSLAKANVAYKCQAGNSAAILKQLRTIIAQQA